MLTQAGVSDVFAVFAKIYNCGEYENDVSVVARAACRVRGSTQPKRKPAAKEEEGSTWAKPKQSGERNENNANKNLRFYEQNAIIAMKMKMNKSVNVNVNVNVTKTGTSFRMKLP